MNLQKSFQLAVAMVITSAATCSAQVTTPVRPDTMPQASPSARAMTDDELISSIFDPVTDDLKLTSAQKSTIVTIAMTTMVAADPLFNQLDELDSQMVIAAFRDSLDEMKLKELAMKQAFLMAEINAMMARAKAAYSKVLTPEQRAIVLAKYR